MAASRGSGQDDHLLVLPALPTVTQGLFGWLPVIWAQSKTCWQLEEQAPASPVALALALEDRIVSRQN